MLFNTVFEMIRRRFKGLPLVEVRPPPTIASVSSTPLDPDIAREEWEVIRRYLKTTRKEGLRIIANLALQGVSVPSDVITAVLRLPQDAMTRRCIIALLGSNQDFTGLDADVKTWLTGFVSHVRYMGKKYDAIAPTVIPGANQLYPTKGEVDLHRYCKVIASLNTSERHRHLLLDDAGAMLPEVVEVLTFAGNRSTWFETTVLADGLLA